MPIAIGWHSVGKEHYAEKRTRLKSHDIVVAVCDIIAVFDGCLAVCFMSTGPFIVMQNACSAKRQARAVLRCLAMQERRRAIERSEKDWSNVRLYVCRAIPPPATFFEQTSTFIWVDDEKWWWWALQLCCEHSSLSSLLHYLLIPSNWA